MDTFMTYGPAERLYQALKKASAQPEFTHLEQEVVLECRAALAEAESVVASRLAYADEIAEAREQATDELEIDDLPVLSEGEDGVWVSAWVWVEAAHGEG